VRIVVISTTSAIYLDDVLGLPTESYEVGHLEKEAG
jgi:hypothetical protein